MKYEMKMAYGVYQKIEVISSETGETIEWQCEEENYDTLKEAQARAEELRQNIGEEVCEWGDGDYGVLREVSCDDEPRGIQVLAN